jgi:hypothetical protein
VSEHMYVTHNTTTSTSAGGSVELRVINPRISPRTACSSHTSYTPHPAIRVGVAQVSVLTEIHRSIADQPVLSGMTHSVSPSASYSCASGQVSRYAEVFHELVTVLIICVIGLPYPDPVANGGSRRPGSATSGSAVSGATAGGEEPE